MFAMRGRGEMMILTRCRAILKRRNNRLRELNLITTTITKRVGLLPSFDIDYDAVNSPPLTPSESRLLEDNDLEK